MLKKADKGGMGEGKPDADHCWQGGVKTIKVPLDLECFFEHSKKPSKEQTHSKKHSWEQIHFFESSKKCSKKFHWSKERSKKCSFEWSTQKRVGYSKKLSLSRLLKKGLIWVEPPKKMLKRVGCTRNLRPEAMIFNQINLMPAIIITSTSSSPFIYCAEGGHWIFE